MTFWKELSTPFVVRRLSVQFSQKVNFCTKLQIGCCCRILWHPRERDLKSPGDPETWSNSSPVLLSPIAMFLHPAVAGPWHRCKTTIPAGTKKYIIHLLLENAWKNYESTNNKLTTFEFISNGAWAYGHMQSFNVLAWKLWVYIFRYKWIPNCR